MFSKVNNKVKKAIAVSLSLVSVMSSMTALAIKPSAVECMPLNVGNIRYTVIAEYQDRFDQVGQWHIDNYGNRSFTDAAGVAVVGLQNIDGVTYYFDQEGRLRTGWQTINGYTYFFDVIRGMLTDWQIIGDDVYYFDQEGIMATNQRRQHPDGNQYWLRADGRAVRHMNNSHDMNDRNYKNNF